MATIAMMAVGVREQGELWRAWVGSRDPCLTPPPVPWDRLQGLERILLLRCLRADSIGLQVRTFIHQRLGEAFMKIPLFDLAASFEDSARDKPLIFILSRFVRLPPVTNHFPLPSAHSFPLGFGRRSHGYLQSFT